MNPRGVALTWLTVAVAACGVPVDDGPVVADDDRVPFSLLAPAPTVTTAPPGDGDPAQVTVCLQRGDRLVMVRHALPRAEAGLAAIAGSGPTPAEQADGLRSALFADDLLVVDVDVDAGVARVDLGSSFTTGTSTAQLSALAQIVCTLTAQRGVGQVAFSLEGAPVDVLRGDGSLSSSPVSRDDYRNLFE